MQPVADRHYEGSAVAGGELEKLLQALYDLYRPHDSTLAQTIVSVVSRAIACDLDWATVMRQLSASSVKP